MNTFEQNIMYLGGAEGEAWLADLPGRVDTLALQWGLKALTPLKDLSFHYVLAGTQNQIPIVLKLGFDEEGLDNEAQALRAFQGPGVVRLLNQDKVSGALLLRRIVPGYSLKSLFPQGDEEAVRIASQVMKTLHLASMPSHTAFPHLSDWLMALERNQGLPSRLLIKARETYKNLLQTSPEQVLLHGDLHHENILFDDAQGWIAIDPMGVIGEPAYEVGAFMRNPLPDILTDPNRIALIQKRMDLFARHLGISRNRIMQWSYVQAVLSACWMLEDRLDPQLALEMVEMIDTLSF